jgi:hypothetical protein
MGHKNQYPVTFNWQATNPATGFVPNNPNQNSGGSAPSGNASGAMTSTNTIYSQIVEISRMDNVGLSVTYAGTATGTFQVMVANSDIVFYALTFDPVLAQPAGSSGGYFVNLSELGAKYLMLQYGNTSGAGTLTVTGQMKDWN